VVIGQVNQFVADIGKRSRRAGCRSGKTQSAEKQACPGGEPMRTRTQEELDGKLKKQQELTVKLDKLPKDVKPETITEDIARMRKEEA
jgi:hypothetical protein